MKYLKISLLLLVVGATIVAFKDRKPTLYIIGDSTVKNGDGKGSNQLQGWGSFIAPFFDTSKISIQNHAIGGRSSRTFLTEGRWDKIMADLQPGDFVIMQFGHNDSGPLDDTARARGTIKGVGEDSTKIYNPIRKMEEWVHSYGWYMRKYANEAKAKGATAIVCSPIPRNDWKDGKVTRSNDSYTKWAKETAETTRAYYIDLNNNLGDAYEKLGQDSTNKFFPQEHTHTNAAGAKFNANVVVNGMKDLKKNPLKKYLL